jgi:CO/xanthine dehydrogenase FAD-binding subunit
MERFGYVRANSIAEAVGLLNETGVASRPLAGGTDLILLSRVEHICDRVVDISLIPEMHRITRDGSRVIIGAGATFSEVVESSIVQETAPLLAQACRQVGATQVRNMGTIGGNVSNAAACADSLPALVCLDAVARVVTPRGEDDLLVADLVLGPNRTKLPAGGLLVSLSYASPQPGSRGAFLKLGRRNAMAISRLTVAALGRVDAQGKIVEARLVPGSATPHIQRFPGTEASLIGHVPSRELCEQAGGAAVAEMAAITGRRWSSEYKEPALQSMVTRALSIVFGLVEEISGGAQ